MGRTVDASAAALGQESSDTQAFEIGANAVQTTVGMQSMKLKKFATLQK